MNDVIILNPSYSTTRRTTRLRPSDRQLPNAKFEFILQLPPAQSPRGEGGLRMQGYFKEGLGTGKNSSQEVGDNAEPLITIITAVFNGEKTLEQTILSVINQSYSNIEYIIIDGGSTDKSLEIIKKYEHAIDYWVSESDKGIYDAWNKGVRLSAGDWVAFLGADDVYIDGAIQAYVTSINGYRDQRVDYISSKVNLIKDSEVLRVVGTEWCWNIYRKYMNVAHVGSLHHKRLFEKYGLFDDTYKISGDYEFLLRSGQHLQAIFLDTITVDMLVGGVSDANIKVFEETAKAKMLTGKRSILLCHIEQYVAMMKWKIRNYLRR